MRSLVSQCAHNAPPFGLEGSNPSSAILINNVRKEVKTMKNKCKCNITNIALFTILCVQFLILCCNQKEISDLVYNTLMRGEMSKLNQNVCS